MKKYFFKHLLLFFKSKILFLLIFSNLLILLLVSCKKEKEEFEFGYDYFPMNLGNYWIYDVVKVEYEIGIPESDTFQIKEVVADTFIIGGELRYRLERYKRDSESDPWPVVPDSIWSAVVSAQNCIRVENNIRFVKLIFPVENKRSWNGNIQNFIGYDSYLLKNVGDPYFMSGKNYTTTACVLQELDTSNFVDMDYRFEVYGKGIGLIHRYKEVYEYFQKPDGTIDSSKTKESGVFYQEILNSYGG